MSSSGKILNANIVDNCTHIPNVQGFEYLGLPIGSNIFITEFIEEKWKKVEKSMYSLYGLGCKPSVMNPNLVGFYTNSIVSQFLDISKTIFIFPVVCLMNLISDKTF
ncbi:unnamed protein product [Brachionus calyciflorus]|uniref:Uncharacterized protein n=1 Tax=Brachionus calyciflorus TaxID=104777 RepID=A0A814ASR5_9BILA|nr:unnamed protein product [Brachionus calyciflorus]